MKTPPSWDSPSAPPSLSDDEVHVWRLALDEPAARFARLAGRLSPDEQQRATRFRFERDRRRFAIARGSLREILADYLGEEPERLRFAEGPHGKPALGEPHRDSGLRFNLSHSEALALCAVTRGREVGVDVEAVRPLPDADALAERFLSAAERAALGALPGARRLEAFFRCWTRKEAYLKAVGAGLLQPLDGFDVSLAEKDHDCLLRVSANPAEASRWSVRSLDLGSGYAAAIAAAGRAWKAVCWARDEVGLAEPVGSS